MKTRFGYSLAGLLAVAAVSTQAFAGESVQDVGFQASVKAKVVRFFQQRIAKHEEMSLEEIRHDLRTSLENNQNQITQAGKNTAEMDLMFQRAARELNQFDDKDFLIAAEKIELQNLMSSRNFMFFTSRELSGQLSRAYDRGDGGEVFFGSFGYIFTFAVDLITLPMTFIVSCFSGF